LTVDFSPNKLCSQITMHNLPGLLIAIVLTLTTGYTMTAPILG
jgi:hypothetical protein